MIEQFKINSYVQKQIEAYLTQESLDLQTAMLENEAGNKAIAAILHAGFPKMVQKIYSLPKMEKFFWEKREILYAYIRDRLAAVAKK